MANERKLNNYTVLYEVVQDHVEYLHVKATSSYNAQAMIPKGRILAVFEGQIVPVLL